MVITERGNPSCAGGDEISALSVGSNVDFCGRFLHSLPLVGRFVRPGVSNEDLERDGHERHERHAQRPAGEDERAVGAVLARLHPVEVAVVPVEAGVDRVGGALHVRAAFRAEGLVLGDLVHGGPEPAAVLAQLEQELALGDPGRAASSPLTRSRP